MKQNINAEAPSEFYRRLELRISEQANHNHAKDNVVLWDNAHYTQNDNYALIVGALEKEGRDSRTVAFDGKVENPWLEAKTKHVPELAALNKDKFLFEMCNFPVNDRW